ncbi:MAG: tetratricopeptide repeat protein [Gemmatimonadetes bacterium]|uniref:Tetratricopeptide repeat protein n=1 Tax=Candidatus Kutchimonas denitrificans TaxID=3056748 RepID=A0AAE5CA08_9BACT|nr:tetratricopeptide repeat protein [Gemmatimonadota bacterium]NIR74027.1 tetratricopeptide repeat protein [Candidatus Kutchimonas denitrificans]NIS03016.1 tetratricopeptide repeat protein [Gemmatimonadota bacterium]NIT68733.1 tetratricopeptide repeat protein [Gemmatimonadota bacterium]NIU53314.1 tetratricopeptide repeat protein [Gemmatimonadota bacterium]
MVAASDEVEGLRSELEQLAEERRWVEIKDRVEALDDTALMSDPKVAYLAAEGLLHLGRAERALNLALAAEAEFRSRQDHLNLLPALNLAGAVQFELGDLAAAEERFSDLLELARERGDDGMVGRATNNLGAIASLRGEHERALSLFRLSIPAYQKVGFMAGLAQADHNLGIVHRDLGYWREAERHFRSAQRRARQLGDERLAAMGRVGLAEISQLRGDHVYAEVEARLALEAYDEIGDELGRADALKLLGSVARAAARPDDALASFDRALKIARQQVNPLLEAEILEERGRLHRESGQTALALADLQAAAGTYRRLGAVERQAAVEEELERIS